jgi:hypothetical protein
MKKLFLLIGLSFIILGFVSAQMSTQKKIIDKKGYIIIKDTAAIDTVHAPIVIYKHDVILIKTDDRSTNGGLRIYINNEFTGRSTAPDIALDARSFSDFDNNDQLRQWLEKAISEEYQKGFDYNVDDNCIDIQYWIVTSYDTAQSYHDTIVYDGDNVDSTYTKY